MKSTPNVAASMNYFGKLLFPRHPSSLRRKEMRQLLWALVAGCVLCAIFGTLLYLMNRQGRL